MQFKGKDRLTLMFPTGADLFATMGLSEGFLYYLDFQHQDLFSFETIQIGILNLDFALISIQQEQGFSDQLEQLVILLSMLIWVKFRGFK